MRCSSLESFRVLCFLCYHVFLAIFRIRYAVEALCLVENFFLSLFI